MQQGNAIVTIFRTFAVEDVCYYI